jgi:hypothetical protein
MIRHALAALASAILIAAPTTSLAAGAPPSSPIEKIWTWYEEPDTVTGQTIFYCDGSSSTTGFVTAAYTETYYGCP